MHDRIARAASSGDSVLLIGPSGAGKEVCARAFHARSGRSGPLVAVNCATIPAGLADRLLFGTRRGAYSGAESDAEGQLEAASGGTLFLDEVAELEQGVQAKLLRALEAREVLPLGATKPRKIDIRLCAATLRDLRAEAGAGRFREDLYYRLARPEVRLPPLIERLEELPWLVCDELASLAPALAPSAMFIEACALLSWPGNIRELRFEVREAGRAALAQGRTVVEPKDLSGTAGRAAAPLSSSDARPSGSNDARPSGSNDVPRDARPALSREAIESALRSENGNVTRAARALGWHRNQLRRWIDRHDIDPASYSAGDDREESPGGKGTRS